MRRSRTALLFGLVALIAFAGLAACGSDDGDPTSSTSRAGSDGGSGGKPVVVSAENADLGTIAVDDRGLTVYTLTDASGAAVPCEGSCLEAWPPVLVLAGTSASGGGGVDDVGSVDGPDGEQATVGGRPLYTFAGDAGPGDANGDGLNSFGGTWKVVKVSGSAAATKGTSDTTKPPDDGY